jgi:putative transcriptional regulator
MKPAKSILDPAFRYRPSDATDIRNRMIRLLLAVVFAWMPLAAAADLDKPLVLVAKPDLRDPLYGAAVIVVAPLGADQHVGFIVNRPTRVTLGNMTEPVYLGGPVQPARIFALVQGKTSPGGNSLELAPGLYAAYETAIVDRIIQAQAAHSRFMAGLVAWRAGELAFEIDAGAWYVLEPDAALVMRKPEGLWQELVRRRPGLRL